LPVGRVKVAQIARDALLQLGTLPFYLRPYEVLIPVPPTEGAELLDTTGGIAGVPSLAQTVAGRN
jgi:hypothetical protein